MDTLEWTELDRLTACLRGLVSLSTPERICIGGRSKNASRSDVRRPRAEALVGSQHHQSQLSCSINEPAFPSRPGIHLPTARGVGDGRSGATRSTASMASTGPSPQ